MVGLIILVICVFALLAWYVWSEEKKKHARIMTQIGAQSRSKNIDPQKRSDLKQRNLQKDITKRLEVSAGNQQKQSVGLADLIEQSGMSFSVKTFWIGSIIFAAVMTMLTKVIGLSLILVITIGSLSLFFLPKAFLKMKAKRRQKAFLDDFADALEAMVRLLKAGMPVSESISMVAREFSGPVGEEMSRIYEAQNIGVSLPEATLKAAHRMPLPEMHMLATGITIQQQTGSSLSEALQNLANLIRARYRLKRKVVALSSEATVSAGIIGALPIFVGTMLYFVNPEYTGLLFSHPVGKVLSAGAAIWMCIGIFIMRQMINFKV